VATQVLPLGILQSGQPAVPIAVQPFPDGLRGKGYKCSVRFAKSLCGEPIEFVFKGFFRFISMQKTTDDTVSPDGQVGF
jgi:hypothetical protein